MEKKKRTAIYIDGSNFYFKLKSPPLNFPNIAKFDYRKFFEWLARGSEIISCRYYVGIVRTKEDNAKGQALRKEQQKLFAHLTSLQQKFVIKEG